MEAMPHEREQPVSPRPRKKARRWNKVGCGGVDDHALLNANAALTEAK